MKLTGGLLVAEEYTIISKRTMAIKVTWLNPPAVYPANLDVLRIGFVGAN